MFNKSHARKGILLIIQLCTFNILFSGFSASERGAFKKFRDNQSECIAVVTHTAVSPSSETSREVKRFSPTIIEPSQSSTLSPHQVEKLIECCRTHIKFKIEKLTKAEAKLKDPENQEESAHSLEIFEYEKKHLNIIANKLNTTHEGLTNHRNEEFVTIELSNIIEELEILQKYLLSTIDVIDEYLIRHIHLAKTNTKNTNNNASSHTHQILEKDKLIQE